VRAQNIFVNGSQKGDVDEGGDECEVGETDSERQEKRSRMVAIQRRGD
jgi:hypothetical protein